MLEFTDKTLISQYTVLDQAEFKVLKLEAFTNKNGLDAYIGDEGADSDQLIEIPNMEKPEIYNEE